jgi:DNA replication licensing factor MCM4
MEIKTVIWGTNVNIQESMDMFRDFIHNFTMAMRLSADSADPRMVRPVDHEPFYRNLLLQVLFI